MAETILDGTNEDPRGHRILEGTDLEIAAVIGGSPQLSFQWKFGNQPLDNGAKYAGADSPSLTIRKLEFTDTGPYSLTVTNPSGSVTTNAASVIVLTNPRTATVEDSPGDIGGSVFAPVLFNASGDEHALQFTLLFDPAILGNGEVAAAAGNKAIHEDVIRYISNSREYMKNYVVRLGLVKNPKCPLPNAMRLIPTLNKNDLKKLAKSKNIPQAIAVTAKRLLTTRGS